MHLGDDRLDRPADRFVGGAGVVGMDAALQAHFRRPAIPRLDRATRDFLDGEIIRRAAQILVRAAFREGAELAPEVADVGVIDVAVHDVTHDVATDRASQRVGGLRDVPVVGVARREQAHDVVSGRAVRPMWHARQFLRFRRRRCGRAPAAPVAAWCCPAPSHRRARSLRRRSCAARGWRCREPASYRRRAHRRGKLASGSPAACRRPHSCGRVRQWQATALRGSRDRA